MKTTYGVLLDLLEQLVAADPLDRGDMVRVIDDTLEHGVAFPKGVKVLPIVVPEHTFRGHVTRAEKLVGQYAVLEKDRIRLIGACRKIDSHTGEITWYEPGDWTFNVGDQIVTGSYNFVYTAPLERVLPSGQVTYRQNVNDREEKRMKLHRFAARNWALDWKGIADRNTEMLYTV